MMMLLMPCLNLYAQDSDAPDMALLEFIGEGVKVDNEVIDPMTWHAIEDMTGSNQGRQQHSDKTQDDGKQANRRQHNE